MLYDFILNNDLTVANFAFNQTANYTYSKGNCSSYIDHCFVNSKYDQCIKDCRILADVPDCASDHFPVTVSIRVPLPALSITVNGTQEKFERQHASINWRDKKIQNEYAEALSGIVKEMKPPSENLEKQAYVDEYYSKITGAMHQAADTVFQLETKSQSRSKHKRHHWWNAECTTARDRNRFWFSIWCSMGRPKQGAVHDAYKSAKYTFRKVCRQACNDDIKFNFSKSDVLLKNRRMTTFWNKIKQSRSPGKINNYNDISLDKLEKYYTEKFDYDMSSENEYVSNARKEIDLKLNECNSDRGYNDFVFAEHLMKKYMSKIKLGCSPGSDAITGEHVRYAANTNIVLHLCQLFTVCFKNGIVPTKFKNGILIPILKKATLDPTIGKNYRPVIVSNTLSKVLEMYVVDECSDFSFNDLQFGFIKNRGTNTQ